MLPVGVVAAVERVKGPHGLQHFRLHLWRQRIDARCEQDLSAKEGAAERVVEFTDMLDLVYFRVHAGLPQMRPASTRALTTVFLPQLSQ